MAELIAELERECDAVRCAAMRARSGLAESNRVRREALGILRHARACPADADALGPAFARLWRKGLAGRRRAFDIVDEHRPPPRERPFDPERTPTPAECHAERLARRLGLRRGPLTPTETPTMTRLLFDMEQVAGLARHSREAPARRMTMAQRAAFYGEDRCAVPQPGEELLAPPCLWLVKDEGIYLMSPGLDPDPDPDGPPRRPPVAYADGFDPNRDDRMAVWDRARDAVGGDDFAEDVPIEWVDAALAARSPEFALDFGPDAIGLLLPDGPREAGDGQSAR